VEADGPGAWVGPVSRPRPRPPGRPETPERVGAGCRLGQHHPQLPEGPGRLPEVSPAPVVFHTAPEEGDGLVQAAVEKPSPGQGPGAVPCGPSGKLGERVEDGPGAGDLPPEGQGQPRLEPVGPGRVAGDQGLSQSPPLRKPFQQVADHMPRGCPHARLDGGDVGFGAEAPAQLRLGEPVAPAEGPQQLSKRMPSHEPTSDPGALRGSRRSPENSYHKSTRL